MRGKKVLLVSASFFPEISPRSFRTTELAKELARQGHDLTVYIPGNEKEYLSFSQEYNMTIRSLGNLKCKSVALKGGRIEMFLRRLLRRGAQFFFEWPDIEIMFMVSGKLKAESDYDLLISVAVPFPIHWGVAAVRNEKRKIARCWVADCGDPYIGDTTDSFRKLFYFRYIEKWFCRKADYISVPFDGAVAAYYPEFHSKIKVIPQGFNIDKIDLPAYEKRFDYPVFAYAGNFIPGKRDPRPLLRYLSKDERNFSFVVFTDHDAILAEEKRELNEKLDIRSVIPRDRLLTELCRMDFLINFDNNVSTQLPSKLIDYAITGRPVLNILINDDFSALSEFMDGNYAAKMTLPPQENYDIKTIARQFVDLYSEY